MTRAGRVPVVLPIVHVDVDATGTISINIDGAPHNTDHPLKRAHLREVLDQLTNELGSPIRVEVHEHDGTTYADIVTPPTDPEAPGQATGSVELGSPSGTHSEGFSASGFAAGEGLALAYVVARPHADDDGKAFVRLPPALLASNRGALLLLGTSSGTIATLT